MNNYSITINLEPINDFFSLPPEQMILKIVFLVGWIPIVLILLWGFFLIWRDYIWGKWKSQQKFVLLAIDIPRGNKQMPKAVENIMTYLAGAHGNINLIEKYWEGKFQLCFSLEIVSIEGYTQFLIHTQEDFRDLVEAAVYSQYPDAEITEVNDYTAEAPRKFPDEEYDLWGADYILTGQEALPIKIYSNFMSEPDEPEESFKDPMATLMDLCSSLGKGEQLWFQIIIKPISQEWAEIGDKAISKIVGDSSASPPNLGDKVTNTILDWLDKFGEFIYSLWGDIDTSKKEDKSFKMMNLKPKQKKQIEAINEKVSKLGFEVKMRFIYLAKKEVMNKQKVVNGFNGYIKQFTDLELNGIKPDTKLTGTSTSYFFKDYRSNDRKGRVIRNYISRYAWGGKMPCHLNIEEIATLWHFPVEAVVKAPLIQKAPGRKAEAPMTLPVIEESSADQSVEPQKRKDYEEIFSPQEDNSQTNDAPAGDSEAGEDLFINEKSHRSKNGAGPENNNSTPNNLPFQD